MVEQERDQLETAVEHLWTLVRSGRSGDQRLPLWERTFILKVIHHAERALERDGATT